MFHNKYEWKILSEKSIASKEHLASSPIKRLALLCLKVNFD
jgi:hypothetical protein